VVIVVTYAATIAVVVFRCVVGVVWTLLASLTGSTAITGATPPSTGSVLRMLRSRGAALVLHDVRQVQVQIPARAQRVRHRTVPTLETAERQVDLRVLVLQRNDELGGVAAATGTAPRSYCVRETELRRRSALAGRGDGLGTRRGPHEVVQ
ncbi:unnamed protein product, partial [Ectocarpus fasciculatus]